MLAPPLHFELSPDKAAIVKGLKQCSPLLIKGLIIPQTNVQGWFTIRNSIGDISFLNFKEISKDFTEESSSQCSCGESLLCFLGTLWRLLCSPSCLLLCLMLQHAMIHMGGAILLCWNLGGYWHCTSISRPKLSNTWDCHLMKLD